jgi:hypothetical protein
MRLLNKYLGETLFPFLVNAYPKNKAFFYNKVGGGDGTLSIEVANNYSKVTKKKSPTQKL